MDRRQFLVTILVGTPSALTLTAAQIAGDRVKLTSQDIEQFLLAADIERMWTLSAGITNSKRATLSDGCLTHDAHIQTIDEYKLEFRSLRGTYLNFADTYKHNIAAYLLDKMLDLRMVPVSVERNVRGNTAAVTWWVDDVLMTEKERYQKKIEPPDQDHWNRQVYSVRVFDELIYNIDRNLGNLLITRDWTLWMIDHTRAFRPDRDLRNEKNLSRCDRQLLGALQTLSFDGLTAELGRYVKKMQIDGLLRRRDRIVEFFDSAVRDKGESAILYDYLPRPAHIEVTAEAKSARCQADLPAQNG